MNTDRFSILSASGMAGGAILDPYFERLYQQFNPTRTQLDLSDQSVNDCFYILNQPLWF